MANKRVITKIMFDRSGSIKSCLSDAQGGYDTFIEERQTTKGVTEYISLSEFDTVITQVYDFTKSKAIPVGNKEGAYKIRPRGWTALNDAFVAGISELDARPEASDKSITKVFVLSTDGFENSSKEHPGETGKAYCRTLIEERQNNGWVFVFLGANMDAIEIASAYGISASTTMTYDSYQSRGTTQSASNMINRGLKTGSYAFTGQERSAAVSRSPEVVTLLSWIE